MQLCGPENLWDDPFWGTRCALTDYLPAFDYALEAPRAWAGADAAWWAETFGLDGYVIDWVPQLDALLIPALRTAVDANATSEFFLAGETFTFSDRDRIAGQIDPDAKLDGQVDYPLRTQLCSAVLSQNSPLTSLQQFIESNRSQYPEATVMLTTLGTAVLPRAVHFASGEIASCETGSSVSNGWTTSFTQPAAVAPYERLEVAFALLMTHRGLPMFYYGDEIGLAGGGIPDNRRLMPWSDEDLSPPQLSLRETVTRLAEIRSQHPVLAKGRVRTESVDADSWLYELTGCDGPSIFVAVNRGDTERSITFPAGDYFDLMDEVSASGGSTTVPPRSFLIYRATD